MVITTGVMACPKCRFSVLGGGLGRESTPRELCTYRRGVSLVETRTIYTLRMNTHQALPWRSCQSSIVQQQALFGSRRIARSAAGAGEKSTFLIRRRQQCGAPTIRHPPPPRAEALRGCSACRRTHSCLSAHPGCFQVRARRTLVITNYYSVLCRLGKATQAPSVPAMLRWNFSFCSGRATHASGGDELLVQRRGQNDDHALNPYIKLLHRLLPLKSGRRPVLGDVFLVSFGVFRLHHRITMLFCPMPVVHYLHRECCYHG